MDEMERILSHPRPDDRPGAGRLAEHGPVISSVNRALWVEVSNALRSVRVAHEANSIHLYCYFVGTVSEDDKESMQLVGTSVAADFPDHLVFEHCIASDPSSRYRATVFPRLSSTGGRLGLDD